MRDLESLNASIEKNINKKLGKKKIVLSDFHKIKLSDVELNNFRLDTIRLINKQTDLIKFGLVPTTNETLSSLDITNNCNL